MAAPAQSRHTYIPTYLGTWSALCTHAAVISTCSLSHREQRELYILCLSATIHVGNITPQISCSSPLRPARVAGPASVARACVAVYLISHRHPCCQVIKVIARCPGRDATSHHLLSSRPQLSLPGHAPLGPPSATTFVPARISLLQTRCLPSLHGHFQHRRPE